MSVPLNQVLDCLLRAGLLPEAELAEACQAIESNGKRVDSDGILDELVARGCLTPYQADEVSVGRGAQLVIGNYVILSAIGEGGMGSVFKAIHRRMNRVVALKLLKKEFTASTEMLHRFQQEARAAARLNHPNAVAAYDADESELGHFLVMEYVEGCDLARVVKQTGRLPIADALKAVRQAALGIGYAHSQGVTHRDIKPHNLLRDVSGVVKIADLGLARLGMATTEDPRPVAEQESGPWVAGTVDFMSPEQTVNTDAVDHRADIYSLGCTLYYLLTGGALFNEPTVMGRLIAQRSKPAPSLVAARDDASEELNRIYQKMVAKRPADRFQTMNDVVCALDALQRPGTDSTEKTPALSQRTFLIVEPSRLLVGVTRRFLGQLGADDVHTCGTGKEALEKLEQLRVDVVLASLQLPDMTGLVLAEHIRQRLPWSRAAVVLMTSEPSRRLNEAVRHLACVGVLPKPFDAASLEAAIKEALEHNSTAEAQFANLARVRVLIVDDSSVARRHIQKVLADLGCASFSTVADGVEALAALERETVDLIVTDYNMPRMDGEGLVARVRQSSSHRGVPIILCTTEFDPAKLAPIYQLGVSAICNKSFDPELVRNILMRLFK